MPPRMGRTPLRKAEMSSSSDNIFSAVYSSDIFKSNLDLAQNTVKRSMAVRLQKDMAALDAKYDGSQEAGIESQINALSDQQNNVANYLSNVESSVKSLNNLRTALLQAKDAIAKGSNDGFDVFMSTINQYVSGQSGDATSVTNNNGNGRGSWRNDVTVLSGGGLTVMMQHQFIGTDYVIQGDDGSYLRPDMSGRKLSGHGTVAFADLTMDHLATLTAGDGSTLTGAITTANGQVSVTANGKTYTGTGDQVTDDQGNTYTVTTSDKVRVNYPDGSTVTGTIQRGGLGLLNSFAYGDFNDPDPDKRAAAVQAANKDVDAAFRKLAQLERTLNQYDAGLSGIQNSLNGQSAQLSDQYKTVSEENLSAKQAEQKAIQSRYDIATNSMALSNETTSTFIYQMFSSPWAVTKQSMTDILTSAAGITT